MKKIAALSILLAIAAAGCAKSPEMIAAQLRADESDWRSQEFQLGTDNFRLCLLTLREGRDTRQAAARAASIDSLESVRAANYAAMADLSAETARAQANMEAFGAWAHFH